MSYRYDRNIDRLERCRMIYFSVVVEAEFYTQNHLHNSILKDAKTALLGTLGVSGPAIAREDVCV